MRKNFGARATVYPMPVFILGTYNADGSANAMNAAWGGISEEKEISLCISEDHKTTENFLARKAFTVSMATVDTLVPCDYVGIATGNKTANKVELAGLHPVKSEFVDAPYFAELPMSLECRLLSYDPESCRLVGEIVNVSAEENILNDAGLVDPGKLRPITYDPMNHNYLVLGDVVGKAFRDGKELMK